jgi:ABC-type uncharacterized transport system permease subunit
MPDTLTTVSLVGLTLLALAVSVLALARFLGRGVDPTGRGQGLTLGLVAVAAAGLYAYQHLRYPGPPLGSHLDGLLLLATLFAFTVIFLQHRLSGSGVFFLPLLAFLLAWALCAGTFTSHRFTIHSIWDTAHLTTLTLGMIGFAAAACAAVMYLYADHRLRTKRAAAPAGGLASLESIERLIVHTAALGFGFFALGLVTGLVLVVAAQPPDPHWWYQPKVLLGTAAWLLYALVLNARYATHFRGRRAAWLAIAGLILILATWAVATRPPTAAAPRRPAGPAPRPSLTARPDSWKQLFNAPIYHVSDGEVGRCA